MSHYSNEEDPLKGPNKNIISIATTAFVLIALLIPSTRVYILMFPTFADKSSDFHFIIILILELVFLWLLVWGIIWLLATQNTQDDEFEE